MGWDRIELGACVRESDLDWETEEPFVAGLVIEQRPIKMSPRQQIRAIKCADTYKVFQPSKSRIPNLASLPWPKPTMRDR